MTPIFLIIRVDEKTCRAATSAFLAVGESPAPSRASLPIWWHARIR
jgi:hypothetical protein